MSLRDRSRLLSLSGDARSKTKREVVMTHVPQDAAFDARVQASFRAQAIMATLGATLERLAPGEAELALPFRADLTQQHGFLHAGVLATVMDSACGYAAFTLMPADAAVLSIEFKINLLSPAQGERFAIRARVVRAGKTITVCQADAFAIAGGSEKLVATMVGTMMCLPGREAFRS
jgi:uncharacterized protein (TIGR00369 family)